MRAALNRKVLLAAATLLVVLLPLPLLLPVLNDHAVLTQHLLSISTEDEPHGPLTVALTLLAVYVALLTARYVAFVTASIIDAAIRPPVDDIPAARPSPDGSCPWPLVSIVVPSFNEGPVIRQSIQSLLRLDYPCFEVLVIDDGSTDDTYVRALEASKASSRVRVIRKPNGGKSSALNVGLANARGSLVLNMDADSRLGADALRVCVRHFINPSVGAVAGNIKVANRENLPTRLQAVEYIQGLALERRAQGVVQAVSVIGGPLGMFRRSALIEVGGYDSDTFAEDRDLTLKLLARDWWVTYEPQAQAWAESPSRWLDLLSQRYRWTRGTVQALFKHRRALGALRRRPVLCLSLWYMVIDSTLVPLASLFMLCFFAYVTFTWGNYEYLFLWWLLAALFDVAVTVYCLVLDREDPGLLPVVLLLRFYAIFTDIVKLIATAEELLRLDMTWGKLKREGKL